MQIVSGKREVWSRRQEESVQVVCARACSVAEKCLLPSDRISLSPGATKHQCVPLLDEMKDGEVQVRGRKW